MKDLIIFILLFLFSVNKIKAQVFFYFDCNYQNVIFAALKTDSKSIEKYDFSKGTKNYNKTLSSIKISKTFNDNKFKLNYIITLYEGGNFTGDSIKIYNNIGCLTSKNFNDRTSSIKVERIQKKFNIQEDLRVPIWLDRSITYTSSQVINKVVNSSNGFNYKMYYQDKANGSNRKGIIIIADGDSRSENNPTLNDQCNALAAEGYVAITTSYRDLNNIPYLRQSVQLKQDFENIIAYTTNLFSIPRSNVIVGGISRGGNCTFNMILPNLMENNEPTIAGIKGVILQCAGGDFWKGSAVTLPVIYMANATDNATGGNASEFQNGLNNNNNANVKQMSKCLIIPGEGHCTNAALYKAFIIQTVKQWLP